LLLFCKEYFNEKRNKYFRLAKEPILQRKSACFTAQNRHFYNAKQWVLQRIESKTVTQKW